MALSIHRFEPDASRGMTKAPPRQMSLAVWLLLGLIGCLVATMVLIPVDRIVSSAGGKIVALQQLTVLEALDPSIIKSIDVNEGDTVKKGQVLASLDQTLTAADLDQMTAQVDGLKAQIARLTAEIAKEPFNPTIPPNTPANAYIRLQKALYDHRAAQYAASLQSDDEKINLLQVTIAKLKSDVDSYQQRQKIAQQVEGMNSSLFKSGSNSLLNLLQSTDARVEMDRTMQFDKNTMLEAQHQISSLQADRNSFVQKWFSDANNDLFTARNNLDLAQASLDKAAKHQDLVRVTAAEDGVVLTIPRISVGSVLKQGDTLMTLMPLSTPLQAEARIGSGDIGFVKVGDTARIKIDAFNASDHGYAEGHVVWISSDAFTTGDDGQTAQPYYRVRVSIDSNHFVGVPDSFRLIPGMTLAVDINVGTRLLGRYILGGALKGAGESMREP